MTDIVCEVVPTDMYSDEHDKCITATDSQVVTKKCPAYFSKQNDVKKNNHTVSKSSGRSPPSLMPRFVTTNRSTVGLSLTLGLCRLVLSMMIENDST